MVPYDHKDASATAVITLKRFCRHVTRVHAVIYSQVIPQRHRVKNIKRVRPTSKRRRTFTIESELFYIIFI